MTSVKACVWFAQILKYDTNLSTAEPWIAKQNYICLGVWKIVDFQF